MPDLHAPSPSHEDGAEQGKEEITPEELVSIVSDADVDTKSGSGAGTDGDEKSLTPAPGKGETGGSGRQQEAPYTPEEMRALAWQQIDTSRIPPEMMPFYKAMESGVQRKFQQIAAESRRPAQQEPAPPQSEEDQVFMAFVNDPQGTIARFTQAIRQIRREDPFDERIDQLTETKDRLQLRYNQTVAINLARQVANSEAQAYQQDFMSHLRQALPDYSPELAGTLTDYAINRLGYSTEEIADLTRVALGPVAIKNMKNVYELWKREQAADDKKRTTKKQPSSVERPGSGFQDTQKPAWGVDDYLAMRMRQGPH